MRKSLLGLSGLIILWSIGAQSLSAQAMTCEAELMMNVTHPLQAAVVDQFWNEKFPQIATAKNVFLTVARSGADPSSKAFKQALEPTIFLDGVLTKIQARLRAKLTSNLEGLIPAKIEFDDFEAQDEWMAEFLIALSHSRHGRELITKAWPLFLGKKNHSVMIKIDPNDTREGSLGLCIPYDAYDKYPDKGLMVVALKPRISFGEAVLVFAHELLHAYDMAILEVGRGAAEVDVPLLLEPRAFRFSQLVLIDLLDASLAMHQWVKNHHEDTDVDWLYHMDENSLMEHLRESYDVPKNKRITSWGQIP